MGHAMTTRSLLALIATPLLTHSVHASPRADEIFWALGFIEGTRQLKGVCDERFPRYKAQNETAFLASPYSGTTAEELIAQMEDGPQKIKLQQVLPTVRASQVQNYQSMNATSLEKMCAEFPEYMQKLKAGIRN
jgi:hypothetical protein